MKKKGMRWVRKAGTASALAAAWYSSGALANTQINSVYVDSQDGVLFIDGSSFTQGGGQQPYVELNGQALAVNLANSSNSHIEAALPSSVVMTNGVGYQIFVSYTYPNSTSSPQNNPA